jgi:polyisoprenyl-phosphate glycosyltransferase
MQPVLSPKLALVVPVYKNEGSIGALLDAIAGIRRQVAADFEAVFVVDGSPDRSYARLRELLPRAGFHSKLVCLSRNFGAFSAIRTGLEVAEGGVIAVMAADLQEPPELVLSFYGRLSAGDYDLTFGVRESRGDPWASRMASTAFWALYRRFVMPDIPKGGVDIFALTSDTRDRLLMMRESNTSLLAQLFWLGGRRAFVSYARRERLHGRSAWTLRKKLKYLSDSVFSFTDLPVRLLMSLGVIALTAAIGLGVLILIARISGVIAVPGYAGTMVAILFFGALNALGLGVVGAYAWRTFENTKARPLAVLQSTEQFGKEYS